MSDSGSQHSDKGKQPAAGNLQGGARALPNILFVMFDQMRHDWWSGAGGHWCPTPYLDRLAARGARFTQCYTNSPVCMAARIGLATGLRPHRLGASGNSVALPRWIPTYYQHFRAHGYQVVLCGKLHLDCVERRRGDLGGAAARPFLYHAGFTDAIEFEGKSVSSWAEQPGSYYTQYLDDRGLLESYRCDFAERARAPWPTHDTHPSVLPEEHHIDRVIADRAVDWIAANSAREPWYLFVSFSGPHGPFDPPSSWAKRAVASTMPEALPFAPGGCHPWKHEPEPHCGFGLTSEQIASMRRRYTGLVMHLDAQVGRLVDALSAAGQEDNTYIVFTADHGESLGDRDHTGKCVPTDAAIRVPLLVAGPDVRSGAVCDELCELNDVGATVNDLAGLTPLSASDAVSFADVARGVAKGHRSRILSTYRDFNLIRTHTHKYVDVVRGRRWLGDMVADPNEMQNLLSEERELAGELRGRLQAEME